MKTVIRSIIIILLFSNVAFSQTYTFNGNVDNAFDNELNWDPIFTDVNNFCCFQNLVIDAYCNANSIDNYGNITLDYNSFLQIGQLNNFGDIVNFGHLFLNYYYISNSYLVNLGNLELYTGEIHESEIHNAHQILGEIGVYENSTMTISRSEFAPIGEQTNVNANFDAIYKQDSTSTLKFLLADEDNHTKANFNYITNINGTLTLQAVYSPTNANIPQECGLYEIMRLNPNVSTHVDFQTVKFRKNINGFLSDAPLADYQINIRYFQDAVEMITYYPETSSFIGLDEIWNEPTNWSTGKVPSVCTDVTIPSDLTVRIPTNTKVRLNTLTLENESSLILDVSSKVILYKLESY